MATLAAAGAIDTALTAPRPRARYLCGHESVSVVANRLLPTRLWDWMVRVVAVEADGRPSASAALRQVAPFPAVRRHPRVS